MDIRKYSNHIWTGIAIFLVLSAMWGWGFTVGRFTSPKTEVVRDSIIIKDSLLIDSIYLDNTIIETQVKFIEREYEEQIPIINSNSDSANLVFFSDYIDRYDSSNNKSSTSDNEPDI